MIVEWFTDFVLGLFEALLGLIPFPTGLDLGGFSALFGVMGTFNVIAPVTEALQASAIIASLMGFLFLYRIIKVAVSHVPFIGGGG